MKIKKIIAKEILDSRGNPTLETDVFTKRFFARASVPSGASTGIHEALELRDGGKRYNGKGVLKAINNVNKIALKLKGIDVDNQTAIDNAMLVLDGTKNKKKLGANAILSVSMAVCKAGALDKKVPLYRHIASIAQNKDLKMPVPSFNVINGGQHAGNKLDVQEYMILPVGAKSFKEAMQIGAEVYHALKKIIEKKYGKEAINVGDEGGFAPPLKNAEEPLKLLMIAIKKAGYAGKVKLGMDVAASEFFSKGNYNFEGKKLTGDKLASVYKKLIKKYPIISIEDPFAEDDIKSWKKFTSQMGDKVQIVGDDLLCTTMGRIEMAVKEKLCNALLLKVNQIGTVSEAIGAALLAKKNKWNVMVSHRSGETTDDFIADLAVGLGTGQIKSGAPCRGERLAKYNQLLRIEEESKLKFAKLK